MICLLTKGLVSTYGGIVLGSFSLVMTRSVLCFLICIATSRHLHKKMFRAILRAPVLFFDTNPVGRLLAGIMAMKFVYELCAPYIHTNVSL